MSGRPRVDPLIFSPPRRRFRTSPTFSSRLGGAFLDPVSPRQFQTSPMLSSAHGWRASGPCLASSLASATASDSDPAFYGWRLFSSFATTLTPLRRPVPWPAPHPPVGVPSPSLGLCPLLRPPSDDPFHCPALACGPTLLGPCGASFWTRGLCPCLNSGGACVVITVYHNSLMELQVGGIVSARTYMLLTVVIVCPP